MGVEVQFSGIVLCGGCPGPIHDGYGQPILTVPVKK